MKTLLAIILAIQGIAAFAQSGTAVRISPVCEANPEAPSCGGRPQKQFQCPPGTIPDGYNYDRKGNLVPHCISEAPSRPLYLPSQPQGIAIGNAPEATGNGSVESEREEYKSPGSVAPSNSTADLLNPGLVKYKHPGCEELISYRDRELESEFRHTMIRYNLAKEEKLQQFAAAHDLLNLMDQEWWGGKTGAEIAVKVKLVTDETNAMIKLFVPIESKALDFVENVGVTIGIIRSEVENGAKQASDDAGKEVGWKLAEGLSPIVAVQHGLVDYAENTEGLEKSETEIQVQVGKLVQAAKSWHAKEITAQTEAQYIDGIKQQITDYCTIQPDINIAPK